MNYRETTEYLFGAMPSFQNVGSEAYKPGLERMQEFCSLIGNPEQSYLIIHIAGTNGKGSTSNMLASVLRSAGYRVGLFTSPHLRDFRERMRVDGEMISECEVVDFVAKYRADMGHVGLSFFEMTASMAFDYFARSQVDVAVIECGLGGRLDATNIVTPILSVITNIGLDHTQYLGDTLPQIAAEKGGIIKRGVAVVIGEHDRECDDIFVDIADKNGSEILFAEDLRRISNVEASADYQTITLLDGAGEEVAYRLDLRGEYQRHNLLTLLAAVDKINDGGSIEISQQSIHDGLRSVTTQMHLEGRWQKICSSPLTICDTGHNMHGMRAVTQQLRAQKYDKLYCVLGFARDKDLRQILPLFPQSTHFIFARPKVERAFTVAEIAEVAESLGVDYQCVEGVIDALAKAQSLAKDGDLVFVGGSNFVVAEIL